MSALTENTPGGEIPGVTEVVSRIRSSLERRFPFILVRGEVSDFSRGPSGHIYFCLKDERSRLRCVWFAGSQRGGQRFDPLTGEIYENSGDMAGFLRNGLEIVCGGKVTYYAQGASCQLLADVLEPVGKGLLARKFEESARAFMARGFFAPEKKQKLPPCPVRVALLTSRHGAAPHDFIKIAKSRGIGKRIRLFPVPVQGEGAAEKIARMLNFVNQQAWADVIVLIRGGGSQEDLWAFNEEAVVQAIYDSKIPVLTGIGHEIDRSLADMAADVSAATPSHAAQILWPLRGDLSQRLDSRHMRMLALIRRRLELARSGFEQKFRLLQVFSPANALRRLEKNLDTLDRLLKRGMQRYLRDTEAQRGRLRFSLKNLSPGRRLDALAERLDAFSHKSRDSMLHRLDLQMEETWRWHGRLDYLLEKQLFGKQAKLERLSGVLAALNPEKPLARGFALVFQGQKLLRSVKYLNVNEAVMIRLADGEIEARPVSSRVCGDNDS